MDEPYVQSLGLCSLALAYCDMTVLFFFPLLPRLPLITTRAAFTQAALWSLLRLVIALPPIGMVIKAAVVLSVNNPESHVTPLIAWLVSCAYMLLAATILFYLVGDGHRTSSPPLGPLQWLLTTLTAPTPAQPTSSTKVSNAATTQAKQASVIAASKSNHPPMSQVALALAHGAFKLVLLAFVMRHWLKLRQQQSRPTVVMGPDGTLIREEVDFHVLGWVLRSSLYAVILYLLLSALLDFVAMVLALTMRVKLVDLWNSPFASASPRDFWGRRWNTIVRVIYNQALMRGLLLAGKAWNRVRQVDRMTAAGGAQVNADGELVFKGSDTKATARASSKSTTDTPPAAAKGGHAAASNAATPVSAPSEGLVYSLIAVNIVFGLLGLSHELIMWCTLGAATGENFLFFFLHGNACVLQSYIERTYPRFTAALTKESDLPATTLNMVFFACTSDLFFRPYLAADFFEKSFEMLQAS
ncbi:hypothetical protein CAOG_00438 [Capsaspora owczarzaki ATCC 30864]|uniref:Wax synthase domain-containing protein n=1 Tax=Capsaspora owczarzaki (strain ATCC 30864) TaxID=595528 RepID=A0A0D2VG76_CAPO3|nr:hypothetical protein CAOG_00438 [Capsaspora owczarzaki ATCC 30864]KJE88862.1 hypothetical protein CAOG_000438 [Capsaspora owczarzaki ATCC 30864]|eukprot:XP_004365309.1 hypothetical protein CAOG_00438 [Capsaspora owczarzaki ATCC 30864]